MTWSPDGFRDCFSCSQLGFYDSDSLFRVTICPGFYRLSQNNFLVWKINYMVTLDNRKEKLDLIIITNYILIILPKGGLIADLIWCYLFSSF